LRLMFLCCECFGCWGVGYYMISYFNRIFRVFVRRMRSVPPLFGLLLFLPVILVIVANWDSFHRLPILICLVAGLPVLVIPLLFATRELRNFRRKRVTPLLSGHICPHCGYSLMKLPSRDDGFTLCPECGVVWRLPEMGTNSTSDKHLLQTYFSYFIIILIAVYLVWSTVLGEPVFSFLHFVFFGEMVLGIIIIYIRKDNRKKNIHRLVMGNYHKLEWGNCPACHVVLDGVAVDWDGVSTCSQCGAVWKISNGEVDGEISEPTEFGRRYLIPTRVVDREGKQVLRLRPRNDWNAFIIKSLMKKQCPGCLCSLSDVKADDKEMTRCPECEAVWVLPGEGDVGWYDG